MNTQFLNFIFAFCTYINKYIIKFGGFLFIIASGMYGRPAKNPFYNSLFSVNVNYFRGSYLVITTTISYHVDQSVISNIINVPRYFIRVPFNNNFKFGVRI